MIERLSVGVFTATIFLAEEHPSSNAGCFDVEVRVDLYKPVENPFEK